MSERLPELGQGWSQTRAGGLGRGARGAASRGTVLRQAGLGSCSPLLLWEAHLGLTFRKERGRWLAGFWRPLSLSAFLSLSLGLTPGVGASASRACPRYGVHITSGLLGFCWAQPPCDLVGPPLPGCASSQTPHCCLPVHRVCLIVRSHIRPPTLQPGPTKSPFLLSAPPKAWSLNRDLPPGLATGSWLCSLDLLFCISSLIPL